LGRQPLDLSGTTGAHQSLGGVLRRARRLGLVYSYAYIGFKRLGAGQFYLITIKDKDGEAFDGGKTYRLTVPPNPPVEQYWSATAYDRGTHALIRNMPRASRSSQIPEMQKNADGSVNIFFGPAAPVGKESNRTIVPLIYLPDLTAGLPELPEAFPAARPSGSATSTIRAGYRPPPPARSPGALAPRSASRPRPTRSSAREVERRAVGGRGRAARPVRAWRRHPAALVVHRRRRPGGREPDADPAVRQLQPARRLVPGVGAGHHGELGGQL
jgi:hypothetical protein